MPDKNTSETEYRCGYIALVGKPNVGKSTLMNNIIGEKISIVTAKPQTTRQQIVGIHTSEHGQTIYVDTPGIHHSAGKALNRYMNRVARAALRDIDVVAFLVEAGRWSPTDEHALKAVLKAGRPTVLVVNKIDLIPDKGKLLPFVESISKNQPFEKIYMISALKGKGVKDFQQDMEDRLPFSRPFYDADQITNRSQRFLAAELIREQLTLRLHQELPYAITVSIDAFEYSPEITRISATIWVERDSQKQIVIGKKGAALKQVGTGARLGMQDLFEHKIFLKLWVKVSRGWSDDEAALDRLGFD